MKKYFLLIIVCCLFSSAYSLEATSINSGSIVNTWIWEKSIGGSDNPYTATPKTIGFNKKIVFTPNGRVITYKNNVEIRNSTYKIEKGIGYFDQAEHDLITFEGKTYLIENLDNQNLTIVSNNTDASRTIYKR
ncbi:hypothetical protein ACHRVW_06730 [Flavobacterium collinsii]|jgi:hypothetical protein|uniref:Lipocalin-like domain-containing protein n=1 Tax=Flavobacterium collinsii TaxID=1114861 RepID=A0A9W4X1S6_9FLAO|nr:hypothetical protein [Flavobacterium collinsii]GIQ58349.1 hypothetical protein Flavo103_14850 [Flavobacterium collinsii]CAA9201398.1 hypothetical protein FLACOL7796_03725 [Flavobacterium collinsii]CAI2765178.1 conserved exported protein of unknown function [Flavobacterium collinsii]